MTTSNRAGLFGYTNGASIRDVHIVDGKISGIHAEVGLLVGKADGSTRIVRSSAAGSIAAGSHTGGLVGLASAIIDASFAAADVQGHRRVGGLVGGDFAAITDSYATGSVSGTDEVGGLVGRRAASIDRSYATGSLSAVQSNVGGLAGGDIDPAPDSFWDVATTGQATTAGGGTGKSTTEMTTVSTFADVSTDGLSTAWKITDGWQPYVEDVAVWGICEAINDGYPFLLWQFESDPCVAGGGSAAVTPPPTVSCAPVVPVVDERMSCTVTGGDPGIDILWRAAYNPVIAEAGVTLDASGSGEFSFAVPAAALGEELTVELVEWIAPVSLGVVGGPVPSSVPSGGGPVPVWLLGLFGLVAVVGLGAGRRAGATPAVPSWPNS